MSNEYLTPGSRSAALFERARKVMPGGNSRSTVFSAPYPVYIAEASGAAITDVEGQTRLDLVNNYTALIHGHAHPRILAAVQQQLGRGTAMSFPTESEVSLAELLVERIDSLEHVRFTNSGTEAVMMAVQAARAFTGRPKIVKFEGCYHGAYLEESPGLPSDDMLVLPFNDVDAMERALTQHGKNIAAVVVDPLPHRPGFVDPVTGFLPRLREVSRAHNVLLISDEIISFRLDYRGPQNTCGYSADLTTLAKIVGGGFPVGAFGGRADVMAVFDPSSSGVRVPHGGTFNANPVTMVAGHAAMSMLTPAEFEKLANLGQRLRTGLADLLETLDVKWQVTGQASLFKLHPHMRAPIDHRATQPTPLEHATMHRFYLAMLAEGIVLTPELAGCLSTPMSEAEVDQVLVATERAFAQISTAVT